jgi:hypothetical protein
MALSNGVRLPVGTAEVFPAGCHLLPDSISEAQDWGRGNPGADPGRGHEGSRSFRTGNPIGFSPERTGTGDGKAEELFAGV